MNIKTILDPIRYQDHFEERVTSTVYHATNFDKLYDIVRSNKFNLSPSFLTQSNDVPGSKFYYLSVSYAKFSGYAMQKQGHNQVILVLDGDKFNERYKGIQVDYWGPNFRPNDYSDPENIIRAHKNNENEERIVSDSPTIPNALSYIKEVHLYLDPKQVDSKPFEENNLYATFWAFSNYRHIQNIFSELYKEHNIPCYVYIGNLQDFKILNNKKALDILGTHRKQGDNTAKTLVKLLSTPKSEWDWKDWDVAKLAVYEWSAVTNNLDQYTARKDLEYLTDYMRKNNIRSMRQIKDTIKKTIGY